MKQIENFKNYFVDETGNVFSNRQGKLKKLSPILTKYGYYEVTLCAEKQVRKKVHRLVAEAFIPNPENKPQINHINGIKTDNKVENIEWSTSKENINHARKTGLNNSKPSTINIKNLRRNGNGEENSRAILTEKDVLEIRNNSTSKSYKELSQQYGVKVGTIYQIVKRLRWTHI
jgi:hypothetical protein